MPLSNDLISQFVKITKDETKTKPETSTYGTVVGELDGRATLRLDGSDLITPASKTADVRPGDRVTVMIKNHTAVITGNLSSPAARVADLIKAGVDISTFEALLAGTATVGELNAMEARVDDLEAKTLTADQIDAVNIVTEKLKVGIATTEQLTAVTGEIDTLKSKMLTADTADLRYASVDELRAFNGRIDALSSDLATIDTLIFGSATGTTIQTSFANAVIAQLGDAQIKSAMIQSISASKISAGDIITDNVRVKSNDGRLLISDQTMQISDANRVRVQIGKDASNDYSINIWDASGNLMFSKGGITDSAIKSAIIRNDMVSETANISASKLDIDSLFEEINGSTKTIKSTRVYLDENKQTLDVVFKSLSSTVTSQGTAISTIQGQITSKIWQQDIDTATNEMSTQYSALEQEVNGISATVASHTTQIGNKADGSIVNAVSDRVTTLEIGLDGFKSTVRDTYATKEALSDAETSITQLSNNITANATETTNLGTRMSTVEQTASGLTTRLNNQQIGGTNILRNTNNVSSLLSSSKWVDGTWRSAGGGTGERTVITITDAPNGDIKKGFRITSDDTDTTTCQDYVPVTSGMKYTMSCYARGTGILRLQVGRSPYSAKTFTFNGVTEWTKCSLTYTAGDGNGLTDGQTNVYFGNRGIGTLELCGFKMELGTVATDWTPSPYDYNSGIDSASKTATDYLSFSDTGLVIGNLKSSSLGKNVLIDSDSVDIRSGDTVLASFGASTITLGQNAANSVINLCDGAGTIRALISEASTSYPKYDSIEIASQEINTSSQRFVTDVTNSYGITSTPAIQNDAQIYMLSNKTDAGSFARMEAMCTTTSSGAEMSAGASAIVYDTYSKSYMQIYAHDSTDTLNRSNWIKVYPHKTSFNQPLYRYITGHEYAIFDESMDTGWKDVTSLGSDFVVYSSDLNSKVRYRKRGKIVEIRGAVKPTSAIAGSADNYTIFTLPSGYRPDSQICVLSQGSGSYNWLLSITSGGVVRFSRYSNGSEYVATSTSSWLPINAMFLIN